MEKQISGMESFVPIVSYLGLKIRKDAPPYPLVGIVSLEKTTEVKFRYQDHELSQADYSEMLEDMLSHPDGQKFVEAIVTQYSKKPVLCSKIARKYRLPAEELNDWLYVLSKTGMVYTGMDPIETENHDTLLVS